jgi:hypothetical protein
VTSVRRLLAIAAGALFALVLIRLFLARRAGREPGRVTEDEAEALRRKLTDARLGADAGDDAASRAADERADSIGADLAELARIVEAEEERVARLEPPAPGGERSRAGEGASGTGPGAVDTERGRVHEQARDAVRRLSRPDA